jgi:hypothetical protein
MAWKLKGRYVSACSCTNVCPCPTSSAPPDNPDGTTNCWGAGVWDVREGNSDGVDLSGLKVALVVNYPEVIANGNWKIGAIVDESASDEQVSALEAIVSGQQGGPFGDMAALVAEFAGVQRGPVSYSDSGATIGGKSFTYEPLRGQDGTATTVKNAVFGFAPEFEIGNASGQLEVFGHSFDASYGEAADFEYGSETHERIRA